MAHQDVYAKQGSFFHEEFCSLYLSYLPPIPTPCVCACVHVSACVCELSVSVCASEWCDSVCMGGEDTFPPSPQLQYLFYKQGSYYKMK